jgi:hypothetical protein
MTRRSFFTIAALGLFAVAAFGTPSHAASVSVSVNYTAKADLTDGMTSLTFTLSGLSSPTSIHSNILTYGYNPSETPSVFTETSAVTVSGSTFTVTFGGPAFTSSGSFSFATTVPNSELGNLSTDITLTSYAAHGGTGASVTPGNPPVTFNTIGAVSVPEPTSMSLLGIGLASFVAFRRFAGKNRKIWT